MYIVHVFIHVKSAYIDAFKVETLANVRNSIREPGIARFDFSEQIDAPHHFLLTEVYRTPEDTEKHKKTAHYIVWRDAVAHMMREPRSSIKYSNIAPNESGWDSLIP